MDLNEFTISQLKNLLKVIGISVTTIVPQLSKCLKFEAIQGDRLTKGFVFKQRDITRVCIVVQRMAHHNHLIHLNYPDLSSVKL